MHEQVIVPLDGSPLAERALPVARDLAHAVGAAIVLVMVESPFSDGDSHRALTETASRHGTPEATTVALAGEPDPARVLAELAHSRPDTLVCLSTQGRGRSEAMLGSTTEALLRRCRRPMVLVGPRCRHTGFPRDGQVMAALDPHDGEAPAITGRARAWARALELELMALSVLDQHNDPVPVRPIGVAGDEVPLTLVHDQRPERALLAALHDDVALMVAGSHTRTRVRRLSLGHVAMATVHRSPVPVLIHPVGTAAGDRPPRLHRISQAQPRHHGL